MLTLYIIPKEWYKPYNKVQCHFDGEWFTSNDGRAIHKSNVHTDRSNGSPMLWGHKYQFCSVEYVV
jgi:hypothetical protein